MKQIFFNFTYGEKSSKFSFNAQAPDGVPPSGEVRRGLTHKLTFREN